VANAVVLPSTIQASPRQSGLKRFYRKHRNLIVGLLFISPWIVGFAAFLVYPILYTVMISFTRYSGFGEPVPIGLENYQSMVNDDLFWIAVGNTAFYLALAVPIGVVVAMVLAIAMNQPVREVSIYRAIIYLPSILPLFALSFVYLALLDPNRGIFNQFLIPGIGPVIAGGILGAALTGAAVGATAGGLFGALREWGLPEEEANTTRASSRRVAQSSRYVPIVPPGGKGRRASCAATGQRTPLTGPPQQLQPQR